MPVGFDKTVTVSAADRDGIAASQSPSGAGDLTLVSSTVTLPGVGQLVTLYAPGNMSGVTFTIYGTAPGSTTPMSISTAGPNATTKSVDGFGTVTRVAVSGAATSVEVGWEATGYSQMWPCDWLANPFQIGFGCAIKTGSPTYSVQHTFADLYGDSVNPGDFEWFINGDVSSVTASTDGNYCKPISALRLVVTGSGTSVHMKGWQAVGHT